MQKSIIRVAITTAGILLIPVFGNLYINGWNWSGGDFIFAFILIFGTGLALDLVRKSPSPFSYKVAMGAAVVAGFFLIWVNAAVGLIGDNNPVSMLYPSVVLIGIIGALITRVRPWGMSRTLFIMAGMQMLIPVVGLIFTPSNFAPGILPVFDLNAIFALLWIGSAILFRRANPTMV